jgi:hypothetical protein
MMNFLQWAGAVGVIVSYFFMITNPRLSVYVSIVACTFAGLWAYLLTPTAWGVLTIEVFVIVMGLRNLWKLR